jgi:iron complex outermembrane recepter protein
MNHSSSERRRPTVRHVVARIIQAASQNTDSARSQYTILASLALGVGALASSSPGVAQTAPRTGGGASDELQEVVVSGYRQSLESSIAAKRNSDQVIEVVTAEDIAKLPDNSIAESLARLPGLAAQRVDGRDQVIALRGLGPDFTMTTFNGREMVSTGDNRAVEFDLYPSELVNRTVVYKTGAANLAAEGIAGTVDMQTIRPLEYGRTVKVASARVDATGNPKLNSGTETTGYRATAIYVGRFFGNTLGVSAGFAQSNSPTQQEMFRGWGYPTTSNLFVPGGTEIRANSEKFDRTAMTSTIEWKPTDTLATSLDLFYSRYQDDQIQRGLEVPLQWSGAQLQPGYASDGSVITRGTFTGVKAVGRSDFGMTSSKLYAAGWNTKWTAGEWTATGDISYSMANRLKERFEAYYGTGQSGSGATDTIGFTNVGLGLQPGVQLTHQLNYADTGLMMLADPNNWNGGTTPYSQDGFLNQPRVHDSMSNFKLDLTRNLSGSFVKNVEFGVNHNKRIKDYHAPEWYVTLTRNLTAAGNPALGKDQAGDYIKGTTLAVPASALVGPTDLTWSGMGRTLAFDNNALLNDGTYTLIDCGLYRSDCATQSAYNVTEKVTTAFAQVRLAGDLGATKVTGNVGLQLVHTDQSSTGYYTLSYTQYRPYEDGARYNTVLPSLNLNFTLPNPDHVLRLGLSREMMRARMDQLKARWDYSFGQPTTGGGYFGASGGNPQLRPWLANAVDLTYEFYFAKAGYLSVAPFYKKLLSNVVNVPVPYDFTSFATPAQLAAMRAYSQATGIPVSALAQGFTSIPQNGPGGRIGGVETAFALPLDMLWSPLAGFGFNVNASFTETNLELGAASAGGGNSTMPVPGYSKWTGSATLYYEKRGFGARVAATKRSSYLSEVWGYNQGREFFMSSGEGILAAQLSYDFSEGSLTGLSLFLSGENLNNEPFRTYQGTQQSLPLRYEQYGARYFLGGTYKF